jgi:MFS family permease
MLGGRVGDLVGRRRALVIGTAGFAAASALGGAAADPAMLLGARALQGVFAALLAPSTISLVSVMFSDRDERARAFGIFSATLMVGTGVGLLLGGVLTQFLSWRWCMYINVPIAVLVVVGARRLIPAASARAGIRLDLPGAVLASAGLGAFVFAIGEADVDGWGSPIILGLLAAAIVLLGLFAVWQTRATQPLLPLRILADRRRLGANLSLLSFNLGNTGAYLLLTYQAQSIWGYSALQTGVAFLPLIVIIGLVSTRVTPRLIRRYQPRSLMSLGLVLIGLGLLTMTRMSLRGSYVGELLPALVLMGLGSGLAAGPTMNTGTRVADPADATAASSLIRSSQQIGVALGTAIMTTIAASYTATALHSESLPAATVHGYATASYWGAGILLAASLCVRRLIPERQPAANPQPLAHGSSVTPTHVNNRGVRT